ncbi:DUF2851 family protein [Maribacter sp. HTCC2170]|uniref:DUF2851 family protein n=1 Tax=Maribacter sp. (strain HTCC2170 / KCCM 42371) TaxID=313603 RepID=UPI00006B1ABB|nr:DUF2851 family protein [Maribacter sp. HTCC2170]EAR00655.1 hypothetical protein FB2170_16261 [Maribacter sp. HTCC2170]
MREDLLHFIWKYKRLQLDDLSSTQNELIEVLEVGEHNHYAGPDFFNAKIKIGSQLWAGNVEIHLNSSDWYAHHHEQDSNYDNVILHVVWNDDATIYRKDNSEIPTLELLQYVPKKVLNSYQKLFDKDNHKFINCENDMAAVEGFVVNNWLERLYFERLMQKTVVVNELLKTSKNDWESVLYTLLLKNFGLKINGESFLSLGKSLDYSVVRKFRKDPLQLESTLFGMTGILEDVSCVDSYYLSMKKEYHYLKHKFNLDETGVLTPGFFKLRPSNFPTIRLSQFSNLYNKNTNLFHKIIGATTKAELYEIFEISASSYWDNHFTFGKVSKRSTKKLTKQFIDLLIINTILPIKFYHAKHLGKDSNETLLSIVNSLRGEDNSVSNRFADLGISIKTAGDSQAILQLYNEYCTKNKCLQCAIGSSLLNRNI